MDGMDASPPPSSSYGGGTLVEAALRILNAEDPWAKAALGEATAKQWFDGAISRAYDPSVDLPIPDRPARLSNVKLVAPSLMPKLGKAGSLQSRQAILHSLVHTESWAIDLSWDIIARFGKEEAMPKSFFDDFVKVAQDEGRHFTLLAARLQELGTFYGALPAHDGLWDSAIQTSNSLLARLAVEHCVHEARGLDVLPTTVSRFRNGGDDTTADLLETVVYPEEITHCAAGVKWFKYLCQRTQPGSPQDKDVHEDKKLQAPPDQLSAATNENSEGNLRNSGGQKDQSEAWDEGHLDPVIETFHAIVRTHFRGPLKPPFNEQARQAAGFGPEWYKPLAVKGVWTGGNLMG